MQYKIRKISNNKNAMRTLWMEGEAEKRPEIGSHFTLIGEPLNTLATYRDFSTSLVVDIKEVSPLIKHLHTLNSVYELTEIIDA